MSEPYNPLDARYVVLERLPGERPRVSTYSGFGGGDIYKVRKEAEEDLASHRWTENKYGDKRKTFALAEIHIIEAWA